MKWESLQMGEEAEVGNGDHDPARAHDGPGPRFGKSGASWGKAGEAAVPTITPDTNVETKKWTTNSLQ